MRSPKASVFERMQRAELAWWKDYARGITARQRMYALYGMRYEWFWRDLETPGRIVEFGSGPLPAMLIARTSSMLACDTLMPQYIAAGLVDAGIPWVEKPSAVPSGSFDTALLLNVLDHSDDPLALVSAAHRSLVEGGKVLVFVHLDNEDEKHRKTGMAECWGWLEDAGFSIVRNWRRPATEYDPPAFLCVGVKSGGH